uniref:Uncharacterized protein n=1 Tax=Anguilla anguilla TaxID=7936 RepID=A0A0E9VVU1_ANGAN
MNPSFILTVIVSPNLCS